MFVIRFDPEFRMPIIATEPLATSSSQAAAIASTNAPIESRSPTSTVASESVMTLPTESIPQTPTPQASQEVAQPSQGTTSGKIERIQDPYPFPPYTFDVVNIATREALVNVLCLPQNGSLRPISGSGVIIDPRGVILTNAHVAQYVLLSQDPRVDLSCLIRSGSPAVVRWKAEVLFLPPAWIEVHASDIKVERPTGTGEHDYALLLVTKSLDGSPLPSSGGGFPFLSLDVREGVAFLDDQVLAASYPAEFIGGITAQFNLYSVSSVTAIKQLLTFDTGTVDLLSLGGIIAAQGGSSGGAVVNAWGQLVGIITTTSEGITTGERDLRALSLNYIDRDIATESGLNLIGILNGDVVAEVTDFEAHIAPRLTQLLIDEISN